MSHLIISQVCTDGEASQVIAPPTAGQAKNAAVVNSLYQFHRAISKVTHALGSYPEEALTVVENSLQVNDLLLLLFL